MYSSTASGQRKRMEWRDIVNNVFAPLEIDIGDPDCFFGRINLTSLPRIEVAQIDTFREHAERGKSHISKDVSDHFFLNLGREGYSSLRQHGRECTIGPGQMALIYSAAPYSYDHHERSRFLAVKIPAEAINARLSDPHALCGRAITLAPGVLRAVAGLIEAISDGTYGPCDTTASILEESIFDLVGVGLAGLEDRAPRDGTTIRWAIHRRATGFIRGNFRRFDLTPEMIAQALGISTRYLHRVFEDANETVRETLTRVRLEQSYSDLRDGSKLPMSIKEVALRNGFTHQSHFSNLFRSRFGQTPRDLRSSSR